MTAALSRLAEPAAEAAIAAATKTLQLPTIRSQFGQLAAAAAKQRLSHKAFLAEVLTAECDERDARRRIRLVNEAKFPRTKRLADFDHSRIPDLTPAVLGHLASGSWIDKGEPLVLLGDSGTGKTHLLIALGTIAAEQGRRVRYLTCAQLVNELAEAADEKQLSRVLGRYARLDLLCLDLCRHGDYAEAAGCGWFAARRSRVLVVGIVTGSRGMRASCRRAGSGRAWRWRGW
jgi:DNA replication protein DnaC